MADHHPWHRQPGEGTAQYAAFCCYRDAGIERSLRKVIRAHLNARPTRTQQQRRILTHPRPDTYLRSVLRTWGDWSGRFRWQERVRAYDAWRDAERQREADRLAVESALRDAEENERQRTLRREEARAARTVARRLLMRALQGIEAQGIEGMSVRDILPHIQRIGVLLEVGQRLERMALGEVTDRTAVETEPAEETKREIAGMIFAEISEADAPQLEALKQRLLAIKDGSQNR
jgi:hypothetical protein